MTDLRTARLGLLVTTAIGSALIATAAFAQASGQAENAAANVNADQNALEEVVVTATRQADTVNRVPLAVTAQTQRSLDQQGVRTVRDLEALVPSLNTTQTLASGASQFSLRGVGFLGNGQAGAAPVGFYLDDTALQKRNVGGGVATSNGTPLPPLFDLDRVEVLRGPQGTLFGGGSEGGTIRYIQPAPSLTRYSSYARGQVSKAKGGDTSYEAGVAVGGPLIQDKLGFRASVFARNQGGFVDLVDPLTKKVWAHNSGGEGKVRMMRAALAWAPNDRSRVTFDYFSSVDKSKDISILHGLDVPNPIIVPTTCYNANNTPINNGTAFNAATGLGFNQTAQGFQGFNNGARVGPISAQSSTPVARSRSNPSPVAWGDAACNALRNGTQPAGVAPGVTYTLPGFTYGPYDLDSDDRVAVDRAPSKTNLQIASLTLDYNFDKMSVKSITSYIDDQTKTVTEQTGPIQTGISTGLAYNDPTFGLRFSPTSGPAWNPIWGPTAAGVAGHFVSNNRRYGLTQEVRFSSAGGEGAPLSWVGGVYYANIRGTAAYDNYQPLEFWSQTTFGITAIQRFAVPGLETAPGLFNNYDSKRQFLKDVEIAAFAEANYWIIPDKLRATAGIRMSRVSFSYYQHFLGPVTSVGPGGGVSATGVSFAVPSPLNGGTNQGSTSESPVTPKFGLQYQITDNDMVYVSASKGFRAGGVNSQVSYGICQQALDQIGYFPNELPQTYKSDSVWSYELGAKLRLLSNRLQFNAAVYQIDWTDAQYTTNPGSCGLVTTFNVPRARSRGVELEATARLFRGFTVNGSYGYTDAKYTQSLIFPAGTQHPGGPVPTPFTIVVAGQKIPVPPHTASFGARYDMEIAPTMRAYIRGDYRFSASYVVSPFPTAAFSPDAFNQKIQFANFRVGVEYRDFDINLFVNNAFNRDTGTLGGGRTQCQPAATGGTAACTTFNAFNPLRTINTGLPREIGLQVAFRH
jgi:outer membrane receptor protein involved in Fe transport